MKTLLTLFLLIPILSWGMDKNELKEELKYWKALLDDELISQEDYDLKKNELLNIQINSSNKQGQLIKSNEVLYLDILASGNCLDKFNSYNFEDLNNSSKFVVNRNIRIKNWNLNDDIRSKYSQLHHRNPNLIKEVDLFLMLQCKYNELSIKRYDLHFPWQIDNSRIYTATRLNHTDLNSEETFKSMFNDIDKILTDEFIFINISI